MRVVILAAGKGERIYKNFKINKPLIKIKKKTIIEKIIINLKSKNLNKISIVVGFKKKNIINKLKKYKLSFISNLKFSTTDMIYSLMLALKKYNENILFSYSDIIYEDKIFDQFKKLNNNYIYIPYIKNWEKIWKIRKKNIYEDVETFKYNKNKFLLEIGNKIKNKKNVQGQFIGLLYIPSKIRNEILNIFENKFKHKKIQTTQFLNYLTKNNFKIKCLEYKGEWYEIDDLNDYKLFLKSNVFKRINQNN